MRGWAASHRWTILEWWMMTLSQITATCGAAGEAASSCAKKAVKLALTALRQTC
jgi:hypothetical protein